MDPVSEAPASVEFGRFRILPHRREVLADGQPIELGGRAFDILVVLIEANGSVVSKDELISRVWPGRVIEEGNLRARSGPSARPWRTRTSSGQSPAAATSSRARYTSAAGVAKD